MCLVDLQKVRQKNQEMKVLMDQMRNLVWDVNAMLTLRKWHFILFIEVFWGFFFEGGVSLLKTSPTQRLITRRWRGECWIFSLRWLTTPLLVLRDWDTAEEQLPFLLGHMGTVLWLPLMRTTIMSSWTQALCMRQWFLSAIHSFITSMLRFTLDIRFK